MLEKRNKWRKQIKENLMAAAENGKDLEGVCLHYRLLDYLCSICILHALLAFHLKIVLPVWLHIYSEVLNFIFLVA